MQPAQKSPNLASLFNQTYAFSSSAWENLRLANVELLVSKRTKDIEFYQILSRLRVGILDNEVVDYISNLRANNIEINDDTSVLFGRNYEVDELNAKRLEAINAPLEIALAEISVFDETLSEKALLNWVNSINTPQALAMKVGAKVMFTTNNSKEGYYNGEQGKIVQILKENGEISSIIVQKNSGSLKQIQRYSFELSEFVRNDGGEITQRTLASFAQFPLKLAYAITIHKSQGMSIEALVCDLNNIFVKGQLYVALSRAIDPRNLRVFYNKNLDFKSYLINAVRVDSEIKKFYDNNKFLNINESID